VHAKFLTISYHIQTRWFRQLLIDLVCPVTGCKLVLQPAAYNRKMTSVTYPFQHMLQLCNTAITVCAT